MNRKQNPDEIRAKQYLQTLNYNILEYEPLGNVTPDFLIDDNIAIEVRRLNRNYLKDEHLVKIDGANKLRWSIDELYKNIQLVIDEKNEKIDKNFNLYSEWWLILIDYITNGMDSKDFEELKKMKPSKYKFTKVFILSPEGNFKVFKL